jgi:hypothetical protein
MGYAILPLLMVALWVGLATQGNQLAQAVPGAGLAGRMDATAFAAAQRAEVFGTACVSTASATAGLISNAVAVTLATGVTTPAGAGCMTVAIAGGGRNVYAWVPAVPGVAARVAADTLGSLAWYRVPTQGQAVNLMNGQVSAVSTAVPVGSLLDWIQTTN